MKNSSYYIAPVGVRTHDLPHTVASNMGKVSHALTHSALGNVLSRRFHMCSIEVKNTLFRSFCTPMYTCQLWWNLSAQSMHKLNVAYNNAFRFMHHLPTYCSASLMFVVNRVPNCRAVIRNRIYGFMKRLVSSSNALVLSAVTSDTRFRSRIVRHWLKSL